MLGTAILYSLFVSIISASICKPFMLNTTQSFDQQNISISYGIDNVVRNNNYIMLLDSQYGGGTQIVFDNIIQYGQIDVTMDLSFGQNIVNAFILQATNGDEIDFEFVQNSPEINTIIQTNYYYRGIPLYAVNQRNYNASFVLSSGFNTYSIIWSPEYYQWLFNGQILRQLNKNETLLYPDTPTKIKISIWEAKPSIWAGSGAVWNCEPFLLVIKSVEVSCPFSSSGRRRMLLRHDEFVHDEFYISPETQIIFLLLIVFYVLAIIF